jgi:hypothetical protein
MTRLLQCSYRTQRDNLDMPGASCNTTAAVMALEASGFGPSLIAGLPAGKQPEDFLTELGDSPEAYAEMRSRCPWFFDASGKALVRPPEAPMMLDWIVERAYGKALLWYSTQVTLGGVASMIDSGLAVVLRTTFTAAGHIVAAIGYEAVEDVGGAAGQVTGIYIDDPWGNVNTGYADKNGERVFVSLDTFAQRVRGNGSQKQGHWVRSA